MTQKCNYQQWNLYSSSVLSTDERAMEARGIIIRKIAPEIALLQITGFPSFSPHQLVLLWFYQLLGLNSNLLSLLYKKTIMPEMSMFFFVLFLLSASFSFFLLLLFLQTDNSQI